MTLKRQAISGMIWTGGSRVATQALDQTFTIVLVRLLAPGDFGLMAMAAVFSALLRVLADMGFARAVVQRADIDEEYLSTAFWGNFVSGVLICAIALGAGFLAAGFYGQPLVRPIFAALSLRFVFTGASSTQVALLSRQMKFSTLTVVDIVGIVSGGIVGVVMALAGAGVWSLVGQAVAFSFSEMVVLWFVTSWRPKRMFSMRSSSTCGGMAAASSARGFSVSSSSNLTTS